MSHFTVLVVGNNVEAQLAPFHEFECTEQDDEYVQDIDKTDDERSSFERAKERGDDYASFADFLRAMYNKEYVVPFGEEPNKDDHKYGYALQDENGEITKVVDRTNPNAKWDWWVVGGRWAGFFTLKDGATGKRGENGLMGSCKSESGVDQARKGDIDIDGMRAAAVKEAGEKYDEVHAIIAGRDWMSWDECRERNEGDIDAARAQYHDQAVVQDIDKKYTFLRLEDYKMTREKHTQRASDFAIATFAVIKDGQWYERGEMGWWGAVSNESDDWPARFAELLDGLPDDTLLTIVDCHI